MKKYLEATGKTQEEAVANALAQLGLERDDVEVELLARAKTGFLGIGSSPAKVRVTYEAPDLPDPEDLNRQDQEEHQIAEEKQKARQEPERKPRPKKEKKPREVKMPQAAVPVQEQPARPVVMDYDFSPAAEDDAAAVQIREFLTGLMKHMDHQAEIVISVAQENTYKVELVGEHMGGFIGRRGETLDAIQQLTSCVVNKSRSRQDRIRVRMDCEGYRAKREETLIRLAEKTASKAVKYRRNMVLEPMNSYERHIIHTALQDYEGVVTYSTGTDPNRRVVVSYRN